MSILDDARARRDAYEPKRIDYDRMNKVYPKQKAALTRAVKTKDPEVIAKVCKAAITEWDAIGAWPDGWHRWQVALDDALGIFDSIDLRDL